MSPPHGPATRSAWVVRFAELVPKAGAVLDLACGGGRHTRFFIGRGHPVTSVDIDLSGIADLKGRADVEPIQADLENAAGGDGWGPLAGRSFAGVIVTNYLWRPLLVNIVAAVGPGGALIYETFARGNERFGKPSNPDFLLQDGELLDAVRGRLKVVAYECLEVSEPKPAIVQRIVAVRRADDAQNRRG